MASLGSSRLRSAHSSVEKNILSFEWSTFRVWSVIGRIGIAWGAAALFYWIVDVKGWRRWGFFFKVIGMNAITIYILMRTVFNWDFESNYFFGGLAGLFPPMVGAFVTQAGMMALGWLFLYWLYRKNIFLRV